MEKVFDKATVRTFVNNVFERSDNIGSLSVKSVRNQFLEHYGLHKLEPEEREFFRDTVHEVYLQYTDQQNGEQSQGSSVEESQSSLQSEEDENSQTSTVLTNGKKSTEFRLGRKKESTEISLANEVDKEDVWGNSNHSSRKETLGVNITSEEVNDEIDSNDSSSDDDGQSVRRTVANKEKEFVDTLENSSHRLEKNSMEMSTTLKRKSKTKETGQKRSSPQSEESAKLKNLKRYMWNCGLRMNYVKLFAECNTMSQKERTLNKVLRKKTGFEGRITLKMCRKFKQAKEEAEEVAELDTKNIILGDDGRRPRRTRTWPDEPPKVSTMNSDSSNLFSRLKGVIDSDDSASEEDKMIVNHSSDEEDVQHDKKRRRLESASEEEEQGH